MAAELGTDVAGFVRSEKIVSVPFSRDSKSREDKLSSRSEESVFSELSS